MKSVVNARGQGDKNADSSVFAGTMKLLLNSSRSYQFMDLSHYSVTWFTNDGKTPAAMNNEMFKRLAHIDDQF